MQNLSSIGFVTQLRVRKLLADSFVEITQIWGNFKMWWILFASAAGCHIVYFWN